MLAIQFIQELIQLTIGVRNAVGHLNFIIFVLCVKLIGKFVVAAVTKVRKKVLSAQNFGAFASLLLIPD